jgi:solute carrier family 25 protein 34/35
VSLFIVDEFMTHIRLKDRKPRVVGGWENFGLSALAPAMAVLFTNPFDTIKVRLQLQGTTDKVYRNSWDALLKIRRAEGLQGLQKGLTPAILREGSKNLFRIGMYDPIMAILHPPKTSAAVSQSTKRNTAPAWKRALAGSLCGVMGAVSCNPFELVKTRLQSASSGGATAVGHQHG